MEPQFSGIGGGGFAVIHLAKQNKTFVVESREKVPAAATPDMFPRPDLHRRLDQRARGGRSGHAHGRGSRAAQVGHQVAALHAASGDRSWPKRASRSIASWRQHRQLRAPPSCSRRPRRSSVCRTAVRYPKAICSSSPTSPRPSAWIARHGIDVFYKGEIADAIVEAQKRTQIGSDAGVGRMTRRISPPTTSRSASPIEGTYRGYTVKSMSPPTSGGLSVIMMLKLCLSLSRWGMPP